MLDCRDFIWGGINEVDLAASKRMNADDVEAYRFSVDESSRGSHSYELFEFSVGDISTEKAILGGKEEDVENQGMGNSRISDMGKEFVIKGFNFRDGRLMNNQWMYRSEMYDIVMFFRVMALCHTGVPVEDDDQIEKLKYKAESPEEVSFLVASQEFGFQFFRRTQSVMALKEFDPSNGILVER
jgi:phospholipid-translocating ATPase